MDIFVRRLKIQTKKDVKMNIGTIAFLMCFILS